MQIGKIPVHIKFIILKRKFNLVSGYTVSVKPAVVTRDPVVKKNNNKYSSQGW